MIRRPEACFLLPCPKKHKENAPGSNRRQREMIL